MKGTSIVMSPNILEFLYFATRFYPVTATTVVCCILMQILCVVSQKSFSFWGTDPLPRLRPWTPSLLLCPPNNPVRSTPLNLSRRQRCWVGCVQAVVRGGSRAMAKRLIAMQCGERSLGHLALVFGLLAVGTLSLSVATDFWLFTTEALDLKKLLSLIHI